MNNPKKTAGKAPKTGKVATPRVKAGTSMAKGPVKGPKKSGNGGGNGGVKSSAKSSTKQPEPTNKGGTYMAFDNGRLARTYGKYSPTESIDTTGFGKGKKEFPFTTSFSGSKPIVQSVKRGDVSGIISKLKKGATRVQDFRSPSKRGKK
jgi:hypothetical protein